MTIDHVVTRAAPAEMRYDALIRRRGSFAVRLFWPGIAASSRRWARLGSAFDARARFEGPNPKQPPSSGGQEDHVAVQMRAVEKKSLDKPDETRDLSGMGKVDIVKIGQSVATRSTFKPGWQWSKHVKPIVGGESCQALHQ